MGKKFSIGKIDIASFAQVSKLVALGKHPKVLEDFFPKKALHGATKCFEKNCEGLF